MSVTGTFNGKGAWALRALCVCFVSLLILDVYFALNTEGTFRLSEGRPALNYNLLARSLLAGQLHLQRDVHPGRLKEADPASPTLPYPYLFDAIIFNGKYYLQHLPFPALIHALCIALTGDNLPTGLVVVLASFGCVLWLSLILSRIRQAFFPDSPAWILWFVVLSFAFSSAQLYMVSRPVIYHEAVATGVFFALGGAAFCIWSLTDDNAKSGTLIVSGLLFGAAIASRAPTVFYPLCFMLCLAWHWLLQKRTAAEIVRQGLSFAAPVALFAGLLLFYNYGRFGDFFYAGLRHVSLPFPQVYEYCCVHGNYFRLAHVPQNLYHWLLALPEFEFWGWFLTVPKDSLMDGIIVNNVLVLREKVSSIFVMMPVIMLILPVPVLYMYAPRQVNLTPVLFGCAGCSLIVFGFFTTYYFACARFLYEFTPLLFVLVFYALVVLWEKARMSPWLRRGMLVMLSALMIANCIIGAAWGITGMLQ